jgi:glycosyltransferase involved in cell wall biosynthesis
VSAPVLRALFVNEGDSAGTRGQGRFEQIIRTYAPELDGLDPGFLRLRPMDGLTLRAASGLDGRLWRRDLDFQTARWHAIQAARVRSALAQVLSDARPDVLHVHPHTAAFALSGLRGLPPVVLSADAEIWDWRRMGIWQAVRPWSRLAMVTSLRAQRRALETASAIVAWTDWTATAMRAVAPGAEVRIQHPGLDLEHFRPAQRTPREVPRILFVGARFARKGGLDLIDAVRPLLTERRAELDVVSPDDIPAGPGIRVHRLSGGDPQLLRLFQQADCFCLPSYGDAAPWVVLEAMACGTPVIGTRVGAVAEFLGDGAAGILVTPGDVGELHDAVTSLVADAPRREALGDAARERCIARYDARTNTRALAHLMRSIAR